MLANCIFFVIAGHATTSTLLAAGAHLLMDRPRELAALVRRSDWLLTAVEEFLRFVSPTTLTGVTATVDARVAGCPIPAGARRALVFVAANRDPAVFDHPTS